MAGPQIVFHMQGLTKAYPGGKKVFENIHLNFLPDAKIGVVGVNGSGKSTLLRIMAGVDKDYTGEAWAADGIKVGYLLGSNITDPFLSLSVGVFAANGLTVSGFVFAAAGVWLAATLVAIGLFWLNGALNRRDGWILISAYVLGQALILAWSP